MGGWGGGSGGRPKHARKMTHRSIVFCQDCRLLLDHTCKVQNKVKLYPGNLILMTICPEFKELFCFYLFASQKTPT